MCSVQYEYDFVEFEGFTFLNFANFVRQRAMSVVGGTYFRAIRIRIKDQAPGIHLPGRKKPILERIKFKVIFSLL